MPFPPSDSDLHTKFPQEMHVVYQEIQPYLSSQSVDMFHDHLPAVTLRHDVVRFNFICTFSSAETPSVEKRRENAE